MAYIQAKMRWPLTMMSKRYWAIVIWPFVFVRGSREFVGTLKRHEEIHVRQQLEMLVIPFFVVYGCYYLWNRFVLKMTPRRAYLMIPFEREAFKNQRNEGYLKNRSFWAWLNYRKITRKFND